MLFGQGLREILRLLKRHPRRHRRLKGVDDRLDEHRHRRSKRRLEGWPTRRGVIGRKTIGRQARAKAALSMVWRSQPHAPGRRVTPFAPT
jgi:hypothetical protein